MMRRLAFRFELGCALAIGSLVASSLGCSSADFATAGGGGDEDSSADTALIDSSALPDTTPSESSQPDSGSEATPDTSIPADSGDVDSAVDTSVDSSADSAIDSFIDSGVGDTLVDVVAEAPDTCARNACGGCSTLSDTPGDKCGGCGTFKCQPDGTLLCADPGKNSCGGCTVLVGKPGDPCPSCGGKLACSGEDALVCSSSGPKNACGGCSTLTNLPGATCGVCSSGKYVCSGSDSTLCSDPVSTPAPGTSCGFCGTLKYACAPDGKSTTCTGDDRNACGGCLALSGKPGDACGKCGSGSLACAGINSLTCGDPVPAGSPSPGTACGFCGTLTVVCNAGKTDTMCPGDDKNACGGCGTLAATPGAACGSCATWTCNAAKSAVSCVGNDAVCAPAYTCETGACSVASSGTTSSCVVTTHDSSCGDGYACTTDTCVGACSPPDAYTKCDPYGTSTGSGCKHAMIDADGDHYAPYASCPLSLDTVRGDCNDSSTAVHPGADYRTMPMVAGYDPTLATSPPDATASSWDFNCNGTTDQKLTKIGACRYNATTHTCVVVAGWQPLIVPDCGATAAYITGCLSGPIVGSCDPTLIDTTQACR